MFFYLPLVHHRLCCSYSKTREAYFVEKCRLADNEFVSLIADVTLICKLRPIDPNLCHCVKTGTSLVKAVASESCRIRRGGSLGFFRS